MRSRAEDETASAKHHLIQQHPWFNQLLEEVGCTGGVRTSMSLTERSFINKIRQVIIDGGIFNKATLQKIFKTVTPTDLQRADIILRFIKQHEEISEREFAEVGQDGGLLTDLQQYLMLFFKH